MAARINPFEEEVYPPFAGMPKDGIAFLRSLKRNNNREWFQQHRERYERSVRQPFLSLLHGIGEQLYAHDSDIHIDVKRSVYRIYRDVRFSRDKSPYKTWIAASWTFRGGDRKTDPCFYLHIGADEVILGGGIWDQIPEKQKRLRVSIASKPTELRSIILERKFVQSFGAIEGDSLKRVPKGFREEHPAADLLKMKQWLCSVQMKPESTLKRDFLRKAVAQYQTMIPFIRYLYKHS